MIITVEEIIQTEGGETLPHPITVESERFSGSIIEYTKTKACLVISLGQDTVVLRVPINQSQYLRSLNSKLIEALKAVNA